MLRDGLTYSESRMSSEESFLDGLYAFPRKGPKGPARGGPVLFQKGATCYADGSDLHSMIIGDTGSMKTLRFVLPLIYSCAMAGESMVIVDPKGELVRNTADFLSKRQYKTVILNWRHPDQSADRWNPFDRVQKAYQCGEKEISDNYLNDLIQILFFQRTSADKDKYWNETAGQLARGIAKVIREQGQKLCIENILYWRHSEDLLRKCYDVLPKTSDISQDLSGYMCLMANSTKTCIASTFDQLTQVFSSSKGLMKMMSETTFSMEDIGRKKTAVFLVIPDEKTTYHFLAQLFIAQCYESLLDQADLLSGMLPIRTNFILEEFCNIPKLEDIVPMLTAARSRNIRFHIVIQSYSQMIAKYNENISKTIMDNCGNLIYLHTREISFLEYISRLAGRNEFDRPLLSVSRLQHLKKSETVIFHDRCYPMVVRDLPLIFDYPVIQKTMSGP